MKKKILLASLILGAMVMANVQNASAQDHHPMPHHRPHHAPMHRHHAPPPPPHHHHHAEPHHM